MNGSCPCCFIPLMYALVVIVLNHCTTRCMGRSVCLPLYCSVGAGFARPYILRQSLTLLPLSYIYFQVFFSQLFDRKKLQKLPAHGLSKSLPFFARATSCEHSVERRLPLVSATLTTPPCRILCGANCVCTTHDYMLAVLSICKANLFLFLYWN